MDIDLLIKVAYLIASVLFILGIKMLGKTSTARRGNTLSAVAMLLAVVATLIGYQVFSFTEIFITILIGSSIGLIVARRVKMTAMPEMVALFNGFGGGASVLVALSEYWRLLSDADISMPVGTRATVALSIIIGTITFSGSLVAFGKLKGLIKGRAIVFIGQHVINALLFLSIIACSVFVVSQADAEVWVLAVVAIALLLGFLIVLPIGGADMPVVISLLNSYSGIAACTTGFVLNNQVLIITGALVGASGIILTQIMCKAMNRSLVNVLLGGFGQGTSIKAVSGGEAISVKEVGVEESALLFDSASSVIIIPGYGMAVAQAQHVVRELADMLEKRGTSVKFAIHPVAGRMPGHMNVLLAEANIPYEKLIEMDQINDEFGTTDIALVIGANDVVNPAARTTPGSPIFGMPILNAYKARTVIMCKRSMGVGYAGIENELFGYSNCLMLFGDAKASISKVVGELKEMALA